MLRLACLAILFTACATDPVDDGALSTEMGQTSTTWDLTPTLHVGERVVDRADAGGRRVFPVWLDRGVSLDVALGALDDSSVRIAVLGPLRAGTRETIASAGYTAPRSNLALAFETRERGEHLIVVGSFGLRTATSFALSATCPACLGPETDVLAAPKAGALVGTAGLVQMQLGHVLDDRDTDVEVELWASPPAQGWNATLIATAVASGSQVNVLVPPTLRAADDLTLVVREAGGRVLDTGVVTRYAPALAPIVRTDALLYGDLVSLDASGIAGAFEGVIALELRSETRGLTITGAVVHTDKPGQVGNGWNAFDAHFNPPLEDAAGNLNPKLPRNGELLSIGTLDGDGGYQRLGCFEYCNDLSGLDLCTGGTRGCPAP